jgi:(S)-ureidoglycine aminohydrolase
VQNLGHTRSSHQRNHLLQTPDTFIRAPLPGMENANAIIHVGPEAGARFTQYTAEMQAGGRLGTTDVQRFVYVLEGGVAVEGYGPTEYLSAGGYAYFPDGTGQRLSATSSSRVAVIEKKYCAFAGVKRPARLIGREEQVSSQALLGDPWLRVRTLLPDRLEFDFAVNTMTFDPGASLSLVEMHVMEHGLLMLEGGGIYRLGEYWYPVYAGDFIWMAPFCPQWFGALGKVRAKYLIYKDWNRLGAT